MTCAEDCGDVKTDGSWMTALVVMAIYGWVATVACISTVVFHDMPWVGPRLLLGPAVAVLFWRSDRLRLLFAGIALSLGVLMFHLHPVMAAIQTGAAATMISLTAIQECLSSKQRHRSLLQSSVMCIMCAILWFLSAPGVPRPPGEGARILEGVYSYGGVIAIVSVFILLNTIYAFPSLDKARLSGYQPKRWQG